MSSAVLSAHRPSVRAGVLTALLALLLSVLAVSGSSPARASSCDASATGTGYGGGGGTDPYLLCSAAHIATLAATSADWSKEFLQTADITLVGNHTPIGNASVAFTGVYNGGGRAITGLIVAGGTNENQGFFGVTDGATLRGVNLVNANVTGDKRVGALVGDAADTTITDSTVSGAVIGNEKVGGMVGRFEGDMSRVYADVLTEGASDVGGLIGEVGVARLSSGGTITYAGASGDVRANASFSKNIGGLIGEATEPTDVVRSFATGDVLCDVPCTGGFNFGGLAGAFSVGTITESFATGDVIAPGADDVGALTGTFFSVPFVVGAPLVVPPTGIKDSYATGSVTALPRLGGLVGQAGRARIQNTYAVGALTPMSASGAVGGLIALAPSTTVAVVQSFWNTDSTGQTASAGDAGPETATGLSTDGMKMFRTFADAGWAIATGGVGGSADVWGICPEVNGGYPFLLWQPIGADCPASAARAPVPSYFAPGGVLPLQSPGLGELVQTDGSSVSLAVSSPAVNQLRYEAPGVKVTFTAGTGSNVSNGLVVNPNGEILCEVCLALAAGSVIEAWMFSEPRLVAAHLVADGECQRFAIPVVAPLDGGSPVSAGAHTLQLALPTAQGMQAVNVGVTIGGPVPGSVPAGEGQTVPAGLVALGLLAAAGAVVAGRREVVAG
jgi:hypothetical protein